jgi:uncharacterized protein
MKGRVVIGMAVAGVVALSAIAQEEHKEKSAAHEQKVRKLLELSETPKQVKLMVDTMIESFRTNPDVPSGFVEKFKAEAKPDELVALLVPIYAKHFSESDIEEIIEFYETPAGKKLVKEQGDIARESQTIAQKWGREIGEKIAKELTNE